MLFIISLIIGIISGIFIPIYDFDHHIFNPCNLIMLCALEMNKLKQRNNLVKDILSKELNLISQGQFKSKYSFELNTNIAGFHRNTYNIDSSEKEIDTIEIIYLDYDDLSEQIQTLQKWLEEIK